MDHFVQLKRLSTAKILPTALTIVHPLLANHLFYHYPF